MKQCTRITLFIVALLNVFRAYPQAPLLPTSTRPAPFLVQFPAGVQKLGAADAPTLLKEHLRLGDKDQFAPFGLPVTEAGITVQRFQQYHRGIKVEHGVYHLHSRGGGPTAISGELYQVPGELPLQPVLSQEQALERALAYVGAETYQWQTTAEERGEKNQGDDLQASRRPQGELVICSVFQRNRTQVTDGGLTLAYKFDIYATRPLSRSYVYVDAHTGTVVGEDAILKHVDGTGHTRYSGSRTISTTVIAGSYTLRDATRGQGVEVYNLRGNWDTSSATDFTDADNQWTAAEHDNAQKDNAALDAHWGAALTYDYFRKVHGRNSLDGNGAKIRCYVHMGQGVINAYWDGSSVLFGDGGMYSDGSLVQPLTSLDITAHEIGHGLCQHTANLVYRYESGALNEAFSDIWGALVENYSGTGKSLWTMGEDANFIIRSFSDPNRFSHPDTYLGQYWYTGDGDNGGVHYNSGVLNHWFYLLSVGKSGVNDHGENYAVSGIGMEKAARIAYHTLTRYLTANSGYTDACIFSMQAAADLFGANSAEAIQTANAWRAVGVYRVAATPSTLAAFAASATQVNLSWRDNATGETGFEIERSRSGTNNFTRVGTTGANASAYQDQGVPTDAAYNYRVRAITGPGTYTAYSNVATVNVGTPPIIMSNTTVVLCDGVLLDPGDTDNYPPYQYVIMTLSPATAGSKLKLTFSAFDTELGADILSIYDGSSTYAPLIGTYSGNTIPPSLTATNQEGQLTLYFSSNGSVAGAGWRATLSCVTPPAAPANLSALAASATQINLNWSDSAADETGFSIERSVMVGSGFTSIATVSANATAYQDKGLTTDARYYYRIRAYRSDVYSAYSNQANAVLGTPPVIMTNGSVTECNGVFLDPGGTGDYGNDQYVIMTLAPATAGSKLKLTFSAFDTELGADVLRIYDGSSTYAPLIGTYSGNTIPPSVTATNADGQLTFYFISSYTTAKAGWRAAISCVTPPAAPTALRATAASPRGVTLQWTDNTADETGFSIERSLSPGTGFARIGTASPNATFYADRDLATDNWYYYRVRAYKGDDLYSAYSNEVSVVVGNAPIRMRSGTLTTCNATFEDSGGTDAYGNYENSTLTLSPADGTQQLRVTFSAFSTESCCDYLAVYDGGTTGAPLIGTYRGSTLPPVIIAANAEGKLTFQFYSDASVTGSGWRATVACVPRLVPAITGFTPSGGPVGTAVTITGAHLGNASVVKFGNDVSATFTLHSDSQITAIVPAGAVAGTIRVVTPWGTAESTTSFALVKAVANVALDNLTHTYDNSPKAATATTVPAGLNVNFTYNGLPDAPSNAGTYVVIATVRSETHQGTATGTLVIGKANATLLVQDPSQTYDGKPKTITVTTTPAGLPVSVGYASPAQLPVNAGSYPFTVNVTDGNYVGSTAGTLIIGKASQILTVADLPDRAFEAAPVTFSATASSGLPVAFTLAGPATFAGDALTATAPGKVTVTASQGGDENYFPAVSVTRTFCVLPPKPVVSATYSPTGVLLTSSSAIGNQWLRNGEPIDGATGTTYQVTDVGSFTVKVSIGGCENVSEAVALRTNWQRFASRYELRMFPNPTPDQVQVVYAAPQSVKLLKLIVYNGIGERVWEHTLAWQGQAWETTVRLNGYRAGLYVFSLVDTDNHQIGVQKVIKY